MLKEIRSAFPMKYIKNAALVLVAYHSIGVASAAPNSFDYLAVTVNKPSYSELDFTPDLTAADLEPLKESKDSEKSGFRLFYGYQFNQYIAAEAGLNYAGKQEYSLFTESTNDQNAIVKTTQHTGSFSSIGADVRLVGTYPVTNNFYLKANVGALAWRSDRDFISKEANTFSVTEKTSNGVSLVTGIGMAYGFKKVAALSLDIEKTEIDDIDTTNIGLTITFRL